MERQQRAVVFEALRERFDSRRLQLITAHIQLSEHSVRQEGVTDCCGALLAKRNTLQLQLLESLYSGGTSELDPYIQSCNRNFKNVYKCVCACVLRCARMRACGVCVCMYKCVRLCVCMCVCACACMCVHEGVCAFRRVCVYVWKLTLLSASASASAAAPAEPIGLPHRSSYIKKYK